MQIAEERREAKDKGERERKIKGLYLIESTWMEVHNIVQEVVIEKHPQEKEMQKGTMVV